MTHPVHTLASRDNPLLKELRKLAQGNTAYRKTGRFWVEGDHLCAAALQRGLRPSIAVFAQSFWAESRLRWEHAATKNAVVPDALFSEISGLESPAKMGFVLDLPVASGICQELPTVILDRVQDAGNVGSILRSAAAFGFKQVIALQETAALWSPKVLRAGMGAHFGLLLHEGRLEAELDALDVPLVVTSSHLGQFIHEVRLPFPCAWVLGHEGQGVRQSLLDRAQLQVRIAQPGGEESLNVAAAAAICLHASAIAAP
ncbi:MAG: TrmH family RNA methyltransferase [Rhodoferax sp.]